MALFSRVSVPARVRRRSKRSAAFLALALVSSLVVVAVEPEMAAATGTEPVVHFVVDVSGSMSGTPLTQAKAAIIASVEAMPDGVAMGLRSYADSCTQPVDPLVDIGTGNSSEIISAVNGLSAGGGTPTTAALQRGIDELDAYDTSGEKRIVLLTDGDTGCGVSICDTVEANLALDIDFTMYTVGLGSGVNSSDLSCAAAAAGGQFFSAPSAGDLATAISEAVTAGEYAWDIRDWIGCFRGSCGWAADPVGTAYGNFFDSWTDLPAQAGVFGLDVVRSYDSLDDRVGSQGRGWRGTFSESVAEDAGDVLLTTGGGREITFVADGLGGWEQPLEFAGVLSQELDDSYRVTMPSGEIWDFDSDGRLEAMSAWDGQSVVVTRDGSGNPTVATSSLGPTLTFSYSGGRLIEVEASDGRSVGYGYDVAQNLASFTDAAGQVTTFVNDASGRVDTITDPEGLVLVDNVFNTRGQVVEQTTPDSTSTFAYNYLARTTTVTLQPLNEVLTYHHDEFGRLVKVTDPDGKSMEQGYGTGGWMTSGVSRLGGETVTAFDAAGNPTSVIDPATGETTYTYDSANRVLTATTAASGTTTYTYAGTDRVPSTITDAESNVTTQTVSGGLVTDVTDADGVTTEFRYNSLRQLIETEDELGNITTFEYDAAGRQNAIEMPSGARTETTYDAAGRPTTVVAADGGETETTYDNAGRVVSVEDPTGAVTSYTYDDVTGLVETMTDPLSRVTTYTYDAVGQLERTTFHDSTFVESDHGILGRVVAERDELGRETSYAYDDDGNVASVEDPAGGVTETTYDTAGRVATTTDAADRTTSFAYDPDTGQLVSETTPSGVISYTYDSLGRVETVTDLREGVTATNYTPAGRTDAVMDPVGLVTEYAYDAAGRLSSVTAPGGLMTSYGYDVDGRVTSVTSPEGDVTATTYDPMGRILMVVDPAGVVRSNTWSLRGELLTESTSGAGTIEYSYDAAGQLSWVDDALDKRTSFTYDARGREVTRTDANSEVWTTAYNAAGEKISETDPLARTTSYTYDPAGRVATVADPSGRTVTNTWLPDGLLDGWSATDGTNTLAADFHYDGVGRRAAATLGGRTWLYAYNAAGDTTLQVDPDGRALGYSYDAAGRRTAMRQPNGSGVDYAYDAAGRVDTLTPTEALADTFTGANGTLPDFYTWISTIGTRATMGIDANAVHMTVGAPNGSSATLSSKLANSTGGDTTLTYRFDSASTSTPLRVYQSWTSDSENYRVQITANNATATLFKTDGGSQSNLGTFTVPVGTDDYRLRFRQDGNQLKAKVWAANSAEPDTWGLEVTDTAGGIDAGKPRVQLASGSGADNGVTLDNVVHHDLANPPTPLVDYSWDNDGRLTGEDLPGSSERSWIWDDGQLVQMLQTAPGVTRWQTADLEYDAAGRLTEIVNDPYGGDGAEYTYDAANQLLSEQIDGGTPTSWTYDNLGRRATETKGANTDTYTYDDAGQLTGITHPSGPASAFTYDSAGRRTGEAPGSGGTRSFTYNPAGQLDTYTAASGESQTRRYNPDGSPDTLTNTVSSVTKVWTLDWDHSSGLAELAGTFENGSTGTTNAHTTLARANGTPWATGTRGPDDFTLGTDTFGSTLETTGINTARSDGYSAWGVPDGSGTLNPRLGYRGEVTNKELLHLRAREYQPATGQFLSTDPLDGVTGAPVVANPYHYADNDPIGMADPTGLRSEDGVFDSPAVFGWAAGGARLGVGAGSTALSLSGLATVGAYGGSAGTMGFFLWATPQMCCSGSANHGTPYPTGLGNSVAPPDTLSLLGRGNRQNPSTVGISGPATRTDNPGNCPAPPGSIGPHLKLREANRGFPTCEAHHIVQDAAVKAPLAGYGYTSGSAMAIVLTGPVSVAGTQHYIATRVQERATIGGTLNAEFQVAVEALQRAGMPRPVVAAALFAAENYFLRGLGLSRDQQTRVPGTRPAVGG